MYDTDERVDALEAWTTDLERRLFQVERQLGRSSEPVVAPKVAQPASAAPTVTDDRDVHVRRIRRSWSPPVWIDGDHDDAGDPPAAAGDPAAGAPSLEDLVGGRLLAWIGGAALLLGVVFFLAIAVSRGWLGEAPRCLLAAAGALGLLGLSVRLRERGARQEAVLAAAGAALGALFVDVAVATRAYALVPAAAGTLLAMAVGAAAMVLAVRWRATPIGALGVLGGLLAPVLAGAPADGATIALLLAAAAAAAGVLVMQRWEWLGLAAFAVTAPQVVACLDPAPAPAASFAALAGLGVLATTQAVGFELRTRAVDLRPAAAFLLTANALLLAGAGAWAFRASGDHALLGIWLVALATAHGAVGLAAGRSSRVSTELRMLALALGVALADVAIGVILDGAFVVVSYAVAAGAMALAASALRNRPVDAIAAQAGLGAHVLLASAHALVVDAPLAGVADGASAVVGLVAVAAASFAGARTARLPRLAQGMLDAVALGALAYLAAITLAPLPLVLAWAGEAVALARVWQRTHDEVAGGGALAHLGGSALVALVAFASPVAALADGFDPVLRAVAALGAVTLSAAACSRLAARHREASRALAAAAVVGALLLGSRLVVTAAGGGQTAQMWLSALWAAVGVTAVVGGLLARSADVRRGALALLGLTAAKVFVLDLAGLDSAYRAVSFAALGILLLSAAFAWQRLRPLPAAGG